VGLGIYRDTENGVCGVCVAQEEGWKERVINESVVYNSLFDIDFGH